MRSGDAGACAKDDVGRGLHLPKVSPRHPITTPTNPCAQVCDGDRGGVLLAKALPALRALLPDHRGHFPARSPRSSNPAVHSYSLPRYHQYRPGADPTSTLRHVDSSENVHGVPCMEQLLTRCRHRPHRYWLLMGGHPTSAQRWPSPTRSPISIISGPVRHFVVSTAPHKLGRGDEWIGIQPHRRGGLLAIGTCCREDTSASDPGESSRTSSGLNACAGSRPIRRDPHLVPARRLGGRRRDRGRRCRLDLRPASACATRSSARWPMVIYVSPSSRTSTGRARRFANRCPRAGVCLPGRVRGVGRLTSRVRLSRCLASAGSCLPRKRHSRRRPDQALICVAGNR